MTTDATAADSPDEADFAATGAASAEPATAGCAELCPAAGPAKIPAPMPSLPRRLVRTVGCLVIVLLSLLCFPSVVPWMVACWVGLHTILVVRNRPAWLPLVVCCSILVIKLVPRTPGMIGFACCLLLVAASQTWNWPAWRDSGTDQSHRAKPDRLRPRSIGTIALWMIWVWMAMEWRTIQRCDAPGPFDGARPIVCIGDSLTQGLIPDPGYPGALESLVTSPVINLGYSGITTTQGLGLLQRALDARPQVVVIELGGHDFLKGHRRELAKQNLVAMIQRCREADVDVILMEIPRGFILDPFASLEREIAYQHDVQLVSDTWLRQIVLMSPIAPPGMWMPNSQLSDDGIHSNTRGSAVIAERVAMALRAMYGDQVSAGESPNVGM